MNKFIQAVKTLDIPLTKEILRKDAKWINWSEDTGKNALHYLCGLDVSGDTLKAGASLQMLKLLLESGMDINAVQRIAEICGFFPATPLWYAYTRGRNETLFTYLLAEGANPDNCMYAIAWYDDVKAAGLFKKHGAKIDDSANGDTPFLAAFIWKRFGIAEWFLKNGANVNAVDSKGNTALYYAVKRKYKAEQVKLLLRFGADCDIENMDGVSARKLAETNRQGEILKLFAVPAGS